MTGSRKIVPSCLSVIQVDLGADATKIDRCFQDVSVKERETVLWKNAASRRTRRPMPIGLSPNKPRIKLNG